MSVSDIKKGFATGDNKMAGNNCDGCTASVHMNLQEMDLILDNVRQKNKDKLAADSEYKRRLDICKDCAGLMYKTTCRYCGCVIQIKALLEDSKCSFPYHPNW